MGISEGIDSLVGLVSPRAAARRKAWRAKGAVAEEIKDHARFYARRSLGFSRHHAASVKRGRANWSPGSGSADDDILDEVGSLRDRSRDLNRNDGFASGITLTMETNVVGTGLKPQSRLDAEAVGFTEARAKAFRKSAERAWRRWADSPCCDSTNRMHFFDSSAWSSAPSWNPAT